MEIHQPASKKVRQPVERSREPRRLPIATLTLIIVTGIVTSLQLTNPALLPALDRNFNALAAGQWWRLVTPRFVQPEIWPQYILLAILAVVGLPVERRFGSLRWLILWLIGGLVGEIVSFAWEPQGAGASLGLCGIIGAWLVLLLWRERYGPRLVPVIVFSFITNMVGLAAGNALAGAVLSTLVAWLLIALLRHEAQWQKLMPALGGAGLFGGFLLTLLRDQHGPPIIAGAGVAAVMFYLERSARQERWDNEP